MNDMNDRAIKRERTSLAPLMFVLVCTKTKRRIVGGSAAFPTAKGNGVRLLSHSIPSFKICPVGFPVLRGPLRKSGQVKVPPPAERRAQRGPATGAAAATKRRWQGRPQWQVAELKGALVRVRGSLRVRRAAGLGGAPSRPTPLELSRRGVARSPSL
jgi:hypothetical protein